LAKTTAKIIEEQIRALIALEIGEKANINETPSKPCAERDTAY
jgi:hypothetical protein